MDWTTVELSNYPPQLTRQDVRSLFKDYTISPDFALPNARSLAYPLRTVIKIGGEQEARRAIRELCWSVVCGRQIYMRLVEKNKKTCQEEEEQTVDELGDEMKNGILKAAHVYYPHLASKFLEIRECVQGITNFAFLQARDCVAVNREPETHRRPRENNMAKWELVASGRSGGWSWKMKDGSGRLAALKDLQDTLERQGIMRKIWDQWEEKMRRTL